MKRSIIGLAAVAATALAGCNPGGGEDKAAGNVANKTAAASPKRPTYCFFKDSETKSWSASAGAGGEVAVKGQGHVKDSRYRALISDSEIAGTKATAWLTIGPNTTGYGSAGDWWDVSYALPGSGGVTDVTILCGKKVVAELKVKR